MMSHYSLLDDSNVEGSFYIYIYIYLFFFLGGGWGFNIYVAFRIRKENEYSCLYLIHLGWIAQSWVKINQDSAKFGFRYETLPKQF